MAKKATPTKLDEVRKELKEKESLKITLQRRVPLLIKNLDTVELENVYEQIAILGDKIYKLEQQRFNLLKPVNNEKTN
ncbi:MAG: hypothetical protein HC836_37315 [Richelia sp. RM2_1_2]|nr:hypothetical protein [Richelia sp. RM2_1_2]